ncbi:uncharacterized protein LOC135195288 isoform X2 [Macrobrachium nipponense]
MSSKKITYSSDFKLKVLDYYFKHGGDDKFGLKKKTAGHFNIDKKTINRMLNNPEMVKRARKLLTTKKTTASGKLPPTGSRPPVKPAVRKAGANPTRVSNTPNKSASSSQSSASSSSSNKVSTSSTTSTKSVSSSSRQQVNSTPSGSNKATSQKPKSVIPEDKGSPGVEVFELPEDPDYSLLKRSINAATNGVGGLAKLLVTGTEEVRNVVLNECDVILECKVCRSLFRSVVNFLAHKRIYCQDEFADVRTLFHKGDVQGVTTQSSTVVVEPEPPPDTEDLNTMRTTIPTTYTSPIRSAQGKAKHSGIDSIALKLARKRKAYHASSSSSSSSTNTGSSSYYKSLGEVSRSRDKLSRDCSVMLEDIGGVTNAVFQSFIPPGSASPSMPMSSLIEEASNSKSGLTVAINQNGEIVKTASGEIMSMDVDQSSSHSDSKDLTCLLCNTRFATQKTLSVHQRSHHGFERCIYSCPICQASFLSMWAVVKHLQRTHKKTKNQIERLRKVVRKNVRKKIIYQKAEKDKDSPVSAKDDNEDEVGEEDDEEEDEEEKVEDSDSSPVKSAEIATPKKSGIGSSAPISQVKGSSHKNENDDCKSTRSPDHRCMKCARKFNTPSALESHGRFCSLMQMAPPETPMNPLFRSETPEKKIAIQIRKDYKKSINPFEAGISSHSDEKCPHVMFKIPKTPQEKENQSRIEEMMGEFCDLSNFSCIPCGKKYQSITTLKRHSAYHMDWTRFQCSLCHYKSYHRYEVINHCATKHNVKENIAGGMVIEKEQVGQLKYFLDNEDAASVSSDVDQDQSGDFSSSKGKSNSTAPDSNNPENKSSVDCDSDVEKCLTQTKFVEKNMLHEQKDADEGEISKEWLSPEVQQNLKESITCKVESDNSKESITVRQDTDPHVQIDKSHMFEATENKPECSTAAQMITDSNPLTEEENIDSSLKNDNNMKMISDASTSLSLEHEVSDISNTGLCKFSSSEEKYSSCKNETATNQDKILKSGEIVTEMSSIPLEESKVHGDIPKASESSSKILEIDQSLLDPVVDTDNSSSSSDLGTEKLIDTIGVQAAKIHYEYRDEIFSQKLEVKPDSTEDVLSLLREYSPDKDIEKADSESMSSYLEISEPGSVIESSENTAAIQSGAVADCADDDEIVDMGMESEAPVNENRELESRLTHGEKIEWETLDEREIFKETEGIHEEPSKDAPLTELCTFADVKPTSLDIPFSVEKDNKPIPKDDPSLDFIGFPSAKDENIGRPSRVKRTIEHKDFIYETKKSVSQTGYDEDDCIILPSEEGRSSVRRRSSLKLDPVIKKSRNEDEGYKSQSCNGSNLSSTGRMKIEDLPVPQRPEADTDELESSYFETSSNEKRKVRLERRRPDVNTRRSLIFHIDSSKSKPGEALKVKNLEKVSESSSSSKSLRKESPTMTRYSSRLKLASSPLPKKEKRQDTLNTRIITNGQGQSNPVATTNKVKL